MMNRMTKLRRGLLALIATTILCGVEPALANTTTPSATIPTIVIPADTTPCATTACLPAVERPTSPSSIFIGVDTYAVSADPPGRLVLIEDKAEAASVRPVDAAPKDLFTLLAARYGMPSSSVEISMKGAAHPENTNLSEWSVDADGKIRMATPLSSIMLNVAAILLSGIVLAAVFGKISTIFNNSYGMRHFDDGASRWTAGLVMLIYTGLWMSSWLVAELPNWTPILLTWACAISVPMRTRMRVAMVAFGFAACSALLTLGSPIVPPHPSLTAYYGAFGLMTWDMAWLAIFAASGVTIGMFAMLSGRNPGNNHFHIDNHVTVPTPPA